MSVKSTVARLQEVSANQVELEATKTMLRELKSVLSLKKIMALPNLDKRDIPIYVGYGAHALEDKFIQFAKSKGFKVKISRLTESYVATKEQSSKESGKGTNKNATMTYLSWYGIVIVEAIVFRA